jgi:hypothetical protein
MQTTTHARARAHTHTRTSSSSVILVIDDRRDGLARCGLGVVLLDIGLTRHKIMTCAVCQHEIVIRTSNKT